MPSVSEKSSSASYSEDLTLGEALFERTTDATLDTWGNDDFLAQVQRGYSSDKLFKLITDRPKDYANFKVKHNLIW